MLNDALPTPRVAQSGDTGCSSPKTQSQVFFWSVCGFDIKSQRTSIRSQLLWWKNTREIYNFARSFITCTIFTCNKNLHLQVARRGLDLSTRQEKATRRGLTLYLLEANFKVARNLATNFKLSFLRFVLQIWT